MIENLDSSASVPVNNEVGKNIKLTASRTFFASVFSANKIDGYFM